MQVEILNFPNNNAKWHKTDKDSPIYLIFLEYNVLM